MKAKQTGSPAWTQTTGSMLSPASCLASMMVMHRQEVLPDHRRQDPCWAPPAAWPLWWWCTDRKSYLNTDDRIHVEPRQLPGLYTLLQELLKMKLSSGKLQFWECKKTPVGDGTFCPSPILAFYIPPCRKCFPASGAGPSAVLIQKIP